MARRLRTLIADLLVGADNYAELEGTEAPDMPRTDGVTWELLSSTWRRGDTLGGGGFRQADTGEVFAARAVLEASSSRWTTDTAWDLVDNGARTARTPTLSGEGIRSWDALELLADTPEDLDGAAVTSILYRLWDGAQALWWDGADWTTPVDALEDWNTAADLQARFPELPGSVRSLAVVAFLRTSSRDYSPSFYGARVAYSVRQVSPLDDALFRTLLAALRAEVTATGVLELVADAYTAPVIPATIPPSTVTVISLPSAEFGYQVTAVEAVIDLTADPDELEPLAGTWNGTTWTAAVGVPAGHVLRIEFAHSPDLVVRRHQDVELVARLPAVYLAPTGASDRVLGQSRARVRDILAAVPTAVAIPSADLEAIPLEVRIIGELGNDVERIATSLADFLGGTGYRRFVSPETGQPVTVRQIQPPIESSGTLATGVVEARASWILTFPANSRQATTAETLVREDGVTTTLED